MAPRHFYRRARGFLCLAQENLEDFAGDLVATSTNRRLEGAYRRNWWGFSGRRSADVALHARAGPELLQSCRSVCGELEFGKVLVTPAGPNLLVGRVIHTCVPHHPGGLDPRPLPEQQAADIAPTGQEAMGVLRDAYSNILGAAAELKAESLACPAIGCGVRKYPVREAAQVGLRAIQRDETVPYVEVRFWAQQVFDTWVDECRLMGLPCTDEGQVADELWQGLSLAAYQKRRQRGSPAASCPLM